MLYMYMNYRISVRITRHIAFLAFKLHICPETYHLCLANIPKLSSA